MNKKYLGEEKMNNTVLSSNLLKGAERLLFLRPYYRRKLSQYGFELADAKKSQFILNNDKGSVMIHKDNTITVLFGFEKSYKSADMLNTSSFERAVLLEIIPRSFRSLLCYFEEL